MRDCGCLDARGHTITDPDRHVAWHALVVEQGGPAGAVNGETVRQARGMSMVAPPDRTLIDVRKRTGRRT